MSQISALEQLLKDLQIKRDSMIASGEAFRDRNGQTRCAQLGDELLTVERQLAQLRNAEYAVPMSWNVQWTRSSSFAVYFAKTFKGYFAYDKLMRDSRDGSSIALVEVPYCYAMKCGGANDEVFKGEPLAGAGLDLLGAFIVENSSWISAEKKIHQVHSQFDESLWRDFKHFVWRFHDGQIEAIAKTTSVTLVEGSLESAILGSTDIQRH
jgi:hypothetical protein